MSRLRLLKVALQPTFVVVDDDGVEEVQGQSIEVPGKTWTEFAMSAFNTDEMAALEAEYDAAKAAEQDKDGRQ